MRKIKMHLSGGTLQPTFAPLALVVLCFVSQTGFARPKNQIVATIPLGGVPYNMVVSPDSKSVYVTNFVPTGSTGLVSAMGGETFNGVTAVAVASGRVVGKQIPFSEPYEVAVAPNGKFAYVIANAGSEASIFVVDISPQ